MQNTTHFRRREIKFSQRIMTRAVGSHVGHASFMERRGGGIWTLALAALTLGFAAHSARADGMIVPAYLPLSDAMSWNILITFDASTNQPVQHKAFLAYDYTRWQSGQLHAMDRLLFANSVPARFTFLTPWLDVMGTETDWNLEGKPTPDSDATMSLRRAMSGAKPYLLLQNTDFSKFDSSHVENYMQRSLFYGIFPGFFSVDAANDPYWLAPKLYNRDRPLFVKYMPIVQAVAEAGWQPLTLAISDNASVWLERFGAPGGAIYLTLRNDTATAQSARVSLRAPLKSAGTLKDLVGGNSVMAKDGAFEVNMNASSTMVLKLN